MRLSHISFSVSCISLFVNLYMMNLSYIERDGFAWFVVGVSFIVMLISALMSTIPERK